MIAKKIAYNVVFNAVAKVLSTVLALVAIGFITRYLGKEGFGDYATVLAFFSFFGAIADMGLCSVSVREISRKGADEKKIMGNVFVLRVISSLFVFSLAPIIIIFLPYSQEVKLGILLSAAAFLFSSSYMVLNGIFQKNLAMDKVMAAELFGKVIQVGFIILAIKSDWGFMAIIFSLALCMLINFILVFLLSRRYLKFKPRINFSYWKKFLKMSFPMGISVIITFMYFKMDTIMLSIIKGSADVGIYNAAYKIIENITFFPAMIIGLILPLMSRYIFTDREKFENISNKTFKIFCILTVPLIVGALFLAEKIIGLIGGAGFMESANILRVLIFALAFIFFGHFFNSILLAGSLQKKLMEVLAFCAIFNVGTNLIAIPCYSYRGAAIASVFTEMLVVALTFCLTVKYLDYRPKIEKWKGFLFSGLAMAAFLFTFQELNLFLSAIGSSAVYFIFLWLTKAISKEEILSIVGRAS
ncbi:flippase [bacterium]|nr:flippase [bacterium]